MKILPLLAIAALGFVPLQADVKLPAIFGDHMVLQQGTKLPVWGTAGAGEKVTVTLLPSLEEKSSGKGVTTTAGSDGKWRVELRALPTATASRVLRVAGTNTIDLKDVLVGEVWLASGQSNMELPLTPNLLQGQEAIAAANNPQIRIFVAEKTADLTPQENVKGSWQVCTPDSVVHTSAVAYFFGRELQAKLHRPVGLIDSYWGGTSIESWTSLDALATLPSTKDGVGNTQTRKNAEPKDPAGRAAASAKFETDLATWKSTVDDPFQVQVKAWEAARDAAKAAGQPEPPRPNESSNHPNSPMGEAFEYSTLFNGMISPLIPYAMRGAIWYQGESNAGGDGRNYGLLLKTMITDWRTRWAEGDFPFLVVGLANMDPRYDVPVDTGWAGVRDGQAEVTATVPHTALAEAIDIGEAHNIHPLDKVDLGMRLAAAALAVAYHQDVVYQGPRFAGMKIEGDKARITFKDISGGLKIGQPPADYLNALANHKLSTTDPAPPTDLLVGFAVAGDDKKWVFADAKIEGKDVIVSSPQVPHPVAVRYGWASNPQVNLYNGSGFPAVPFRTDDWPFVPPPPHRD